MGSTVKSARAASFYTFVTQQSVGVKKTPVAGVKKTHVVMAVHTTTTIDGTDIVHATVQGT